MRLYALLLTTILLFSMAALAEEETTDPGVTPDSPLWGLDLALEKISYRLTISKEKRAEKALKNAEERLAEVKVMIEENKLEDGAKAEVEHGKALGKAQEDIQALDEEPEEQAEAVIRMKKLIREHGENVEQFKQNINIKITGEQTAEQQQEIEALMARIQEQAGEMEVKIEQKQYGTKIKIKSLTGKSEEEIDEEFDELEEDMGVPPPECETDADCAEGEFCRGIRCRAQEEDDDDDEAECAADADCEGGVCVNGECEDADDDDDDTCVEDVDCPEGKACLEGECERVATCETDEDCPGAKTCVEGACAEPAEETCATDADCAEGEVCDEGECEEQEVPECTTDADCSGEKTCVNGECESPGGDGSGSDECTMDADCDPDETCQDGECEDAP